MHSCKGCQDRHLYCHDTCERYKKDCEERAEIRKKRKEETMYDNYVYRQSVMIDKIKRVYHDKER